ncbi:hypothetical protein [Stratiformator vulcanicus]|uniref:Uncharacterized protein n=1 Tax=Stratiformator vulcanicus TaxID=2527980 RepID=A0A517R482_9PLAN|nr:hypothetical protein [Stratiformator vulcanicus]QDT38688.1 hypothetical protein Pan189_30840 [Stratiformator vulcanicus]
MINATVILIIAIGLLPATFIAGLLVFMTNEVRNRASRQAGLLELYGLAAVAWVVTGPVPVAVFLWFWLKP